MGSYSVDVLASVLRQVRDLYDHTLMSDVLEYMVHYKDVSTMASSVQSMSVIGYRKSFIMSKKQVFAESFESTSISWAS